VLNPAEKLFKRGGKIKGNMNGTRVGTLERGKGAEVVEGANHSKEVKDVILGQTYDSFSRKKERERRLQRACGCARGKNGAMCIMPT